MRQMWAHCCMRQGIWLHGTRCWGTECLVCLMLYQHDIQEYQVPQARSEGWSKEDLPLTGDDQIREYLNKPGICKSTGPDRVHPKMLRYWLMSLWGHSIIFRGLWGLGEEPQNWRNVNVTPIFKNSKKEDPGKYRLVNLPQSLKRW